MALRAPSEASASANQNDNSAAKAGAAYVFQRSAGQWTQQAYLKASNPTAGDRFGALSQISDDGNLLVVSASGEDGDASSASGAQTSNDNASNSGAVYVFKRQGASWGQVDYLKAFNANAGDDLWDVALSGDGLTLAVGAVGEDGSNGEPDDNQAKDSGAIYIFR